MNCRVCIRPYEAAHWAVRSQASIRSSEQEINAGKSKYSQQYLFGRLSAENIRQLVRRNEERKEAKTPTARGRPVGPLYRIWLDDKVKRFTNPSISTVKADAARNAFGTSGKNILWAVVDTGIDKDHPHFRKYENLKLKCADRAIVISQRTAPMTPSWRGPHVSTRPGTEPTSPESSPVRSRQLKTCGLLRRCGVARRPVTSAPILSTTSR